MVSTSIDSYCSTRSLLLNSYNNNGISSRIDYSIQSQYGISLNINPIDLYCDMGTIGLYIYNSIICLIYLCYLIYFLTKLINRIKHHYGGSISNSLQSIHKRPGDLLYYTGINISLALCIWTAYNLIQSSTIGIEYSWSPGFYLWCKFSSGFHGVLFMILWCSIVRDPNNPHNSLIKQHPIIWYFAVIYFIICHAVIPLIYICEPTLRFNDRYSILNLQIDSKAICFIIANSILLSVLNQCISDFSRLSGNVLADQLLSKAKGVRISLLIILIFSPFMILINNFYQYNSFIYLFIVILLDSGIYLGFSVALLSMQDSKKLSDWKQNQQHKQNQIVPINNNNSHGNVDLVLVQQKSPIVSTRTAISSDTAPVTNNNISTNNSNLVNISNDPPINGMELVSVNTVGQ